MKLRLIALDNKSQVIDQLEDLVFNDIGVEDIVPVTIQTVTKKDIIEVQRKLMELSIMTGKAFFLIPCDVKFFRLQEEKVD